ncbi:TIGR01777 family protein [Lysinibacillus yapensis]|uniref:TIGR01777 family protein n=1 Tax=Ureibacillus yapensis TaxID=2304605 RepID=A0A396SNZ0_9BACL|nr:TIGR01777 family oxidoreductase [Lysinibacillus yapensis]RHW37560.1 TIGR01777 family protein [Lysinibacillus yapensis]
MKIVIAGGSGFIGEKCMEFFIQNGHEVIILTRNAKKHRSEKVAAVEWLNEGAKPEQELEGADVFINLAGVSLNAGRWSTHHKQQIYNSRIAATNELLRIISVLSKKPAVLINASAVGIYTVSLTERYTEKSAVVPNDFLGKTVQDWENASKRVKQYSVRTVFMRFGVVLGKEGSALTQMAMPYKFFAGGTVGSGEQWISWVHVKDVVRAIDFAIHNNRVQGPVNVTAPNPTKMKAFGKTIGLVLKRPHWLPVPSLALKIALGEKSKLVLQGQYVQPKVLEEEGFKFQFPTLEGALKDLLPL